MKWALVFFVLSCVGCKQGKPEPSELAIAVERNDLASTNGLLDRGADPNATGGPLGWLVLSTAADHGQLPIVETLLAHHADPNRVDASLMGLAGKTPLQHAAWAGKVDAIRALLKAGAQVDGVGNQSALALAAEAGHLEAVDALLAAGAKIDGTAVDGTGYPPIVVASGKKNVEIVKRLLAAKPRIDARDQLGMTALCVATATENAEIMRLLLAAGADPLAPNRAGWTPAFTAKYHGRDDLVAIYREKGVTDFEMKTPPVLPPSGMGTIAVPVVTASAR